MPDEKTGLFLPQIRRMNLALCGSLCCTVLTDQHQPFQETSAIPTGLPYDCPKMESANILLN